jgi:hypothetical protein
MADPEPFDFLEPDRLEPADQFELKIEYSKAVSLKRIADALEKITQELDIVRRVAQRPARKGLG